MVYFDQKNTQKMSVSLQTHLSTEGLLETLAQSSLPALWGWNDWWCWEVPLLEGIQDQNNFHLVSRVWTPWLLGIYQVKCTADCVQINARMDHPRSKTSAHRQSIHQVLIDSQSSSSFPRWDRLNNMTTWKLIVVSMEIDGNYQGA